MESDLVPLVDGGAPRATKECGLADRFRYFVGASGRRYLFTAVTPEEIGDFAAGIMLIAHRGLKGGFAASLVTPFGGPGESQLSACRRALPVSPGATVYVHLLADTSASRCAVTADLCMPGHRLAA